MQGTIIIRQLLGDATTIVMVDMYHQSPLCRACYDERSSSGTPSMIIIIISITSVIITLASFFAPSSHSQHHHPHHPGDHRHQHKHQHHHQGHQHACLFIFLFFPYLRPSCDVRQRWGAGDAAMAVMITACLRHPRGRDRGQGSAAQGGSP